MAVDYAVIVVYLAGMLALSVFFSARLARLKVYTVSEMPDLLSAWRERVAGRGVGEPDALAREPATAT
ncbi:MULTISPECIES: hypothetical protein [unclassified Streptomyces]|uniref:hypothetical protein n=1 Tax=unclassified Streptomyces TaxID=2593676 RepID=UPI0009403B55|nr:hypothetical protein [Streptomyces sp. TSRI0281]OKI38362.1 hypothetical protein A6A29_10360 [Streptomyces sp. TSRI0281]